MKTGKLRLKRMKFSRNPTNSTKYGTPSDNSVTGVQNQHFSMQMFSNKKSYYHKKIPLYIFDTARAEYIH